MRVLKNIPKRLPFRAPPYPCGDYTTPDGKLYSFRYRPRASKFAGTFGLYVHDKDAGKVLIAAYYDHLWERIETDFLPNWGDLHEFMRSLTLTKMACPWSLRIKE